MRLSDEEIAKYKIQKAVRSLWSEVMNPKLDTLG
jgi:hypothetical protein